MSEHILEELKAELFPGPVVYLIHFHEPLRHARHYVGSTTDLARRMRSYRRDLADSARLIHAVNQAGIAWTLIRVWSFETEQEARDFEYRFKKTKHKNRATDSGRECPACRERIMARTAEIMRRSRARKRAAEVSARVA